MSAGSFASSLTMGTNALHTLSFLQSPPYAQRAIQRADRSGIGIR